MNRICQLSKAPFKISEAEQKYCQEKGIPLPTLSPQMRLMQLYAFRNRFNLYNGKCAYSKKPIFTCVPPESDLTVYDIDIWNSDSWSPLDFGRDYDFGRTFFEQFSELLRSTPIPNLAVLRSTMENSDYTNGITGAKNCYLLFAGTHNEDCMFSKLINHSKNIVDSICLNHCELCYACKDLNNCYNLKWSENCHNCSDSSFLFQCQGCKNCYGCVNLSNKEYHFYNEKLSKEEYLKKVSSQDLGSFKTVQAEIARFQQYLLGFPIKYYSGKKIENSTGSFLNCTKNCQNSFFLTNCEDVENSLWVIDSKSCFSYASYGDTAELVYDSVSCGGAAYNLKFCVECWQSVRDQEYCMFTSYGSHNCFGCVSLKKASYAILNKQYSKDQYHDLLKRIKVHMISTGEYGQFFPASLSPFSYNFSDANDFFPLQKVEALKLGFSWTDEKPVLPVQGTHLPDHIRDTGNEFLSDVFSCSTSGKKYKLTRAELDFYRSTNIPAPRVSPMERLRQMSSFLVLSPLRTSYCDNCRESFETSLPPSERRIYCECCYQEALLT